MTREKFNDFILKCGPVALFSALTGFLSGALVILYNCIADVIVHDSLIIYSAFAKRPIFIPLLFVILIILAFLSYVILKFLPQVKGAKIPRADDTALKLSWWQTILAKIFGSFISFFGGLSLGVEGPATAIGSSVGVGLSSLIKSKRFSTRDKDEVTSVVAESGVTSALTAIFNAPLAGIAFVIEELEHKISGLLVVALTFGSATSLFTSYSLRKLLDLPERLFALSLPTLPPSYFWAILLLGVILGILATLYVKLIKAFGKPNFLKRIPLIIKLIFVFLITGATGIFLTNVLGGGSFVIRELLSVDFPWWILLVMLVVKSLLTALALSSSSHGGLLMPTLAIGAIAGALLGKMALLLGVPNEYYALFVIAGALSFFGGVYRAPISAILLTIELTGNAHGIATIGAEIIITFIVAELLLKIPYRRIFDKIKTKKNKSNDIKNNSFLKTPLDTHQN